MITIITFLITAFLLYIYAIFNEMELDMVAVLSLLTSIAVSVPYYYHKISKELTEIKENFDKDKKENKVD